MTFGDEALPALWQVVEEDDRQLRVALERGAQGRIGEQLMFVGAGCPDRRGVHAPILLDGTDTQPAKGDLHLAVTRYDWLIRAPVAEGPV